MKRLLALLLITLGLSFTLAAQQPTKRRPKRPPTKPPATQTNASNPARVDWVKFTSEVGRFSVLMPGTPKDKTEIVESDQGPPYTSHMLVWRDPKNVFVIGWADYHPSFTFDRQAEMELNRDNFLSGMKARLLDSRPLIIDGYKAIEFTAETIDQIFKSRIYIVGRRPYQIVIGSPRGKDDSVNVDRFFNSFKVSVN